MAGVKVIDASDESESPTTWLRIRTPYNRTAPPLNAKYELTGKRINFTWQHNCQLKGEQPPYYLFTINDRTLNHSITTQINALSFDFQMAKGGEYSFSLSLPHRKAIPIVWNVKAPTLSIPQQFDVTRLPARNAFKFDWEALNIGDTR